MMGRLSNGPASSTAKPILLTGMPGAGKSLVVWWLSRLAGVDVADLDHLFLAEYGQRPEDVIRNQGESHFRSMERSLLVRLLDSGSAPTVLACGGGTLVEQQTLNLVRSKAHVVFLECSLGELERRIGEPSTRPLLRQGVLSERLQDLWMQREPYYRQSDLTLDVTHSGPTEAALAVAKACGLAKNPDVRMLQLQPLMWMETGTAPSIVKVAGHFDAEPFALCLDSLLPRRHRLLILDSGVPGHITAPLRDACGAGAVLCMEGGEQAKQLSRLPEYLTALKRAGAHRGSAAILVGGGSFLDALGTACAFYMRGIQTVLLPTTPLAAVDAAIGGKTALDVEEAKNLCGAFHPPLAVYVFSEWLSGASSEAVANGAAEMLKVAMLVGDVSLARQAASWSQTGLGHAAIHSAIRSKLAVLAGDVMDRREQRVMLNLGHTFGHALESALEYRRCHGACVGAGLVVAARLSSRLGLCDPAMAQEWENLAVQAGFWPLRDMPPAKLLVSRMSLDKKQETEDLVWVLLKDWGVPTLARIRKGEVENLLTQLL